MADQTLYTLDINNADDILKYCTIPIISEETKDLSFRREYDFEWHLDRSPTVNNVVGTVKSVVGFAKDIGDVVSTIKSGGGNIMGVIQDAIASGKRVAAYTVFTANLHMMAEMVSARAETVQPPDDEIVVEKYPIGNVEVPVAVSKGMGNIQVTYIEDQYNNVYNFHKIWQECLRPGSDLTFMDIPSFSVTGRYATTGTKLTESQLDEMYKSSAFNPVVSKKKVYSQTVYPLLFPIHISRGAANATSKNFSRVRVTYVRTPAISKNQGVTEIGYATGAPTPISEKLRYIGWISPNK